MSSSKISNEFLHIPKLDVAGTNWVIYKDRFTWSINVCGLLHHIDSSKVKPINPISDCTTTTAWTPAKATLNAEYKKDLKTWQQGEAVVKQQIAGTVRGPPVS